MSEESTTDNSGAYSAGRNSQSRQPRVRAVLVCARGRTGSCGQNGRTFYDGASGGVGELHLGDGPGLEASNTGGSGRDLGGSARIWAEVESGSSPDKKPPDPWQVVWRDVW